MVCFSPESMANLESCRATIPKDGLPEKRRKITLNLQMTKDTLGACYISCCRIWLAWSHQAEVIYGLGFIWFHPLLQGSPQWLIGLRIYLQYRWLRFNPWVGKILWRSIFAWRIPRNRGAWQATVHGVAESRTWLSD